jgi:prepilin-type N-terminal cleavage/methylation domain-containing protein
MVNDMHARTQISQRGFTATELVVVVAIIGIMAAFAAPSMSKLMQTQKVRSVSYDLFADLTFARSEAISRGHNVEFKAVGATTDWIKGWTVTDVTATPNVQLRVQGQCTQAGALPTCVLADGLTFRADVSTVTFDRSGRSSGNASFDIEPTDATAVVDQKRCVKLDPSGRPRTLTGACA